MKIIITEDQYKFLTESKTERLKQLIKDQFNFDLTNHVYRIKSVSDIPFGYDGVFPKFVSTILKKYTPIYVFSIFNKDLHGDFIFYDIYNDPTIADGRGWHYNEEDFIEKIGLSYIGISLIDILNLYL